MHSEREFDLRGLLRQGGSDDAMADRLMSAMAGKAIDGWAAQKRSTQVDIDQRRTSMTLIGG